MNTRELISFICVQTIKQLSLLLMIVQVPGGNNGQAAADGAAARRPADPGPDGVAPANPHEAGNHRDEAELDDEEEDDDGEEGEEEEDDEEGREEDAADANNGGQGQCDHENTEVWCTLK